MKARRATPEDMDAIARMAKSFHAATCYVSQIPLNLDSALSSVANFATQPNCIMLVVESDEGKVVGMAAASATRHWFNADHIVGQEHFWWVDEEARGSGAGLRLIEALEEWATKIGCHSFCMATTANLTPEALAKFYKRRGYEPYDIYYSKVMTCPVQSSAQ